MHAFINPLFYIYCVGEVKYMSQEQLIIRAHGETVNSPYKYRRHLYVSVTGSVDISKVIGLINNVIPVGTLKQLTIEPVSGLEYAMTGIDIIDNKDRSFTIKLDNNNVEIEFKAITNKHNYVITLKIEKAENSTTIDVIITVDGNTRFIDKYASGASEIKMLTLITIKRFVEHLETIEKITKAYSVLEEIPAKCLYTPALQLYLCKE